MYIKKDKDIISQTSFHVYFFKVRKFRNFSIPVLWNSTCIKDVTLLMDQDCQGKINHKLR
jgi:hypothetical protein